MPDDGFKIFLRLVGLRYDRPDLRLTELTDSRTDHFVVAIKLGCHVLIQVYRLQISISGSMSGENSRLRYYRETHKPVERE